MRIHRAVWSGKDRIMQQSYIVTWFVKYIKKCRLSLEALKELGKTKEEAVYVGDSDVDLETAKNSGMPCISVLWGFRDKEFLAEHGAERYAKTAEDVLRFVEEM